MFNKKLINFLINSLGVITIIVIIGFFIGGLVKAPEETSSTGGAIGYFIGFFGLGFYTFGFIYVLLGIMYKINNKENNKLEKENTED